MYVVTLSEYLNNSVSGFGFVGCDLWHRGLFGEAEAVVGRQNARERARRTKTDLGLSGSARVCCGRETAVETRGSGDG